MLKTGTFLNIQLDPMAGGTVILKMMKDMEQGKRDLYFLIAKFINSPISYIQLGL